MSIENNELPENEQANVNEGEEITEAYEEVTDAAEETVEAAEEAVEEATEEVAETAETVEEATEEALEDDGDIEVEVYEQGENLEEVFEEEQPKKESILKKPLFAWLAGILTVLVLAGIAVGVYFLFFSPVEVLDETVIATVGDQEIKAYEAAFYIFSAGDEDATAEDAVDNLVEMKAMCQVAAENNITLSEDDIKEIDDSFSQMEQYYGGEEMLNTQFTMYGINKDQYKEFMKMAKLSSKVQEQATDLGLYAKPTDEEAKSFYDGNFLRAKHILIKNTDEDGKTIDDAEVKAKADDIYAKISAGEPFENFAELSEDPGSAENPNGYLFLNSAAVEDETIKEIAQSYGLTMVPEFEQAAAGLKVNEVSAPVKTSYGYHIIKKLDINEDPSLFKGEKETVLGLLEAVNYDKMVLGLKDKYPAKMKNRPLKTFDKYIETKKKGVEKAQKEMEALQQQMMQQYYSQQPAEGAAE